MVKDKIIALIAELAMLEIHEIRDEDSLAELGIDSLMTVELIVRIEEECGFIFEASELDPEKIATVQAIIELAESH